MYVCGCDINNCKVDSIDIHGDLTAQKYIDGIARPHVEPHIPCVGRYVIIFHYADKTSYNKDKSGRS